MIPTKICGITRLEDAQMAVELGASAIGMIFYPESKRYISPKKASKLIKQLDREVTIVGVFVNETPDRINAIAEEIGLDMVQLSGQESPGSMARVVPSTIKTFHVGKGFDPEVARPFVVDAILLDTAAKGHFGGTGEVFDWSTVHSTDFHRPVILSGGLNPENIMEGIEVVAPQGVDVNSGVEATVGTKDPKKLEQLFNILKDTPTPATNIFRH